METKIVKIDPWNIDIAMIKQAAELLDAGRLVAFPTETVYGIACSVKTDYLERLDNLKGRSEDKYYTLHIGRKTDIKKYLPTISLRAQKLIENAWPGPLTIVFELNHRDMDNIRNNLEKCVFENLYKHNSIGIRCPDNPVASMLLQSTHNPVVAPSANLAGQSPAVTGPEVIAQLSGRIELLLDAGPSMYKKNSTVVKIGQQKLQILRLGVYSQADLEANSQIKFLFVCTGNTCRSPMAEAIFKKYLAEKLECKVDSLEEKGYKVVSAGTIGIEGLPASPEASAVCAAKGFDLGAHKSTALSKQLVDESDLIFAMCRTHRERIVAFSQKAEHKCMLLAKDADVPDPIGQSYHVYDECEKIIEEAVKKRISELII